jgi:hypothetical protein
MLQVKEQAALAAGFLCVGEEFPHSRDIIQGFLDMAKEVRCFMLPDVMFTGITSTVFLYKPLPD